MSFAPARTVMPALLMAGALALTTAPAATADERGVPLPRAGSPWFGPQLDRTADTPSSYARGLGSEVSLVGRRYAYPLTAHGRRSLATQAEQDAAAGAVSVVTLAPTSITTDTAEDADALATALARVAQDQGGVYLVRFAPDMNTPDVAWGMQPEDFVHDFRELADDVHDVVPQAAMVWAPSDGTRYPRAGPLPHDVTTYLDTTRDGRVTHADDPYGPYFPGDDVVDWMGLTVLPGRSPVTLAARLDDADPTLDPTRTKSFYRRYVASTGRPLLLTTGRANPVWARQVTTAGPLRPLLGGVLWLGPARRLGPLGSAVRTGRLSLGPLTLTPPAPKASADPAARDQPGSSSQSRFGSVAGGVLFVLVLGAAGALLQRRRRRV